MRAVAAVIVLVSSQLAQAAFDREAKGSLSLGLGGTCVPNANNPWAVAVNPAAAGLLESGSISVSYRPHAFGLPELAQGSFVYVGPFSWGAVAVYGSHFGTSIYRETCFSITYARSLSKGFSLGASLNTCGLGIERYGSARTFAVDLGISAEIQRGFSWSAAALNVNRPKIGIEGEPLPQILWLSMTYEPVPDATVAADLVKDVRFPYELHIGLGYELMGMVGLRAGISTDPPLQCAGIGLELGWVQFDYAVSNHVVLGLTHQMSVTFELGDSRHE